MVNLIEHIVEVKNHIDVREPSKLVLQHYDDKVRIRGPVNLLVRWVKPDGTDKMIEEVMLRDPNDQRVFANLEREGDRYDIVITELTTIHTPSLLDYIVETKNHIDIRTSEKLVLQHYDDKIRIRGPGQFLVREVRPDGSEKHREVVNLVGPSDQRVFANMEHPGDRYDIIITFATPTVGGFTPPSPMPVFPTINNGDLVQGSGPSVYIIEGGAKRHIPDGETFTARGYNWGLIKKIADEQLNSIPTGAPLPSVKAPQQPRVCPTCGRPY